MIHICLICMHAGSWDLIFKMYVPDLYCVMNSNLLLDTVDPRNGRRNMMPLYCFIKN